MNKEKKWLDSVCVCVCDLIVLPLVDRISGLFIISTRSFVAQHTQHKLVNEHIWTPTNMRSVHTRKILLFSRRWLDSNVV